MGKTRRLVPPDDSVSEGTIALVIQQNGQYLWEYEPPVSWEEAEWVLKKEYDHSEMPSALDLRQARIEQEVNDQGLEAVTVYADTIDKASPKKRSGSITGDGAGQTQSNRKYRQYFVTFSDGTEIPRDGSIHSSQKENMGDAIDYLIEEYDLTSSIEIPYLDRSTGKSSLINSKPQINEDQQMNNPYRLVDSNYLRTTMGRTEKMRSLEELASKVDLGVSFGGRWNEQ